MNLAVTKNTDLSSFITAIDQGVLSSIFSHSVSAIIIYDLHKKCNLYFSKNSREVLGEIIHHKLFAENEYLLNLVAKPYNKKVADLINWKEASNHEKTQLRYSINLPIKSGEETKILLTRYLYLPNEKDVVLIFITNLTDETPFHSIIFTVEKQKNSEEYELLFKNSVSTSIADNSLSPREKEVLQLIHSGLNSKQIGEQLGISINTVSTIRKNIKKKNKKREE